MYEAAQLCEEMENKIRSHQPAGLVYKNICKKNALACFKNDADLNGIYKLTESHAPTYRIKTTLRYDKTCNSLENKEFTMNKEYVSFKCPSPMSEEVECMLDKIAELPKEWTIVQLTTRFNLKESMLLDISKTYTDPLHISVFNCGQKDIKPFCVNASSPVDSSGIPMELCKEMRTIVAENKNLLLNCFGGQTDLKYITAKQKKDYSDKRSILNNRLRDVIQQIEKRWLAEWRCLLIGKFIDEHAANGIFSQVDDIVQSAGITLSKETLSIFHSVIAGCEYLAPNEILKAVDYCIPDNKELRKKICKEILNISSSLKLKNMKRQPVILIVDEKLDCFPWEMLDVLVDHPVSRIPSLHFAYALYKEHEDSVKNGFKEVSASNGSYIVNPGLDLKKMEVRLKQFFKYWLPEWNGISGKKPTPEEFISCLTNEDIFIYNGHGSGTQFLPGNQIQQMRVNSVVLLFGCSSIRMNPTGPFTEMYDIFHNYLIACSPCVVGMIWEVTDFDTDILSTSLLSHWIPSKAEPHWKFIDKIKWQKGEIVATTVQKYKLSDVNWEPELLRAMHIARKEPIQFLTKCAIVARGLPIKII